MKNKARIKKIKKDLDKTLKSLFKIRKEVVRLEKERTCVILLSFDVYT